MRSTKLTATLAAAAALLAVAPAGAVARVIPLPKHPAKAGPTGCVVSEFAEPRLVTSGETVLVFGALSCGGSPVSGQTVTVYERSVGVPGFKVVGTPKTGVGGSYSFTSTPIVTDSLFYVRAMGARSANRTVRVAPQVTLGGPPDGADLLTGPANVVTFTGAVSPSDTGAEVVLQREAATASEEWHTIQARTHVRADGTYTIVHKFIVPGDANLRTVVVRFGRFSVRGVSAALSYEISQAENPNLTILSSANPVNYGLPVTISGVVKGAVDKSVTLLGRTAGTPFATVAVAKTDASGNYSFMIASAQANTYYRVTSGLKSSTILFEGVKWVLTASASATTVPSGTIVTFSGKTEPGRAGHFVYLERQNALGSGFHVVDLSTVTSTGPTTGSYSIPHFVTGSGKEVYRVRIPGDPINQAAASAPIALTVTGAPVVILKPVPLAKEPH